MNRTTIQAVLGLSATLVCALGFATLAHAGGGDNDNPYNMPRNFSGDGSGNSDNGGSEGSGSGDGAEKATASPGTQRGPLHGPPGSDKSKSKFGNKSAVIPVSVEPGASFKFVPALNASHASIEVKGAQLAKPAVTSLGGALAKPTTSVKALAGSVLTAKNLASSASVQGKCDISAGAAKVIARLPPARQSAVAAVSLGTLGANGTFAVEQVVMVPVTTAGLDLSALAAQWSAVPNANGKSIQVQLGVGEPTLLATITFQIGTSKPTFRVDTIPN